LGSGLFFFHFDQGPGPPPLARRSFVKLFAAPPPCGTRPRRPGRPPIKNFLPCRQNKGPKSSTPLRWPVRARAPLEPLPRKPLGRGKTSGVGRGVPPAWTKRIFTGARAPREFRQSSPRLGPVCTGGLAGPPRRGDGRPPKSPPEGGLCRFSERPWRPVARNHRSPLFFWPRTVARPPVAPFPPPPLGPKARKPGVRAPIPPFPTKKPPPGPETRPANPPHLPGWSPLPTTPPRATLPPPCRACPAPSPLAPNAPQK